MNIRLQTKSFNTVLVLIGIVLIVFSYLKLNQNSFNYSSKATQLGTILNVKNDIRLKRSQQFNWSHLTDSKSAVSVNDKIFSNTGSSASIKMNLGHSISLGEDTLIKIKGSNTIKVDKGDISLSLTKSLIPVIIDFGKEKLQIIPVSDSQVKISNQKSIRISVSTGEIELKKNDRIVRLTKNTPLKISENTRLEKTLLISPKTQTLYTDQNDLAVEFKFTGALDNSKIYLSKEYSFKTLLEVRNNKTNLSPGKYFWKVGPVIPESFTISKRIAPPKILKPLGKETFFTFKDKMNLSVILNQIDGTLIRRVQLYELDHTLIQEQFVTKPSMYFKDVKPGNYYIVSKFKGELYTSSNSSKSYFTILKGKYIAENALVIELKKPNQKVKFQWEKAPKDLSLFELSDNPNFTKIIVSKRIRSKNFTHITFPKLGKFYWRSQKLNKDGSKTFQSPIQVIIKPTPAPTKPKALPNLNFKIKTNKKSSSVIKKIINLFFPSAHAAPEKDINISFPQITDAKSYQIEIYKDKELKILLKTITTKINSFVWYSPRAGSYFWRIRYKDHWDRFSEFSNSSSLKIEVQKHALKKKSIKKKAPPSVVIKKLEKEKPLEQSLSLFAGPNSLDYKQKENKEIQISGETYNTWELEFKRKIQTKWINSLGATYQANAGKVFEDKDFRLRQAELQMTTNVLNISPLIHLKQVSSFELNSSGQAQTKEMSNTVSMGLKTLRTLKIGSYQEIEVEAAIKLLNTLDYQFGLNYYYHYNKRIKLGLKTSYLNSKFEFSENDIEIEYFQLLAGLLFYF